jgi:hypothetical protein
MLADIAIRIQLLSVEAQDSRIKALYPDFRSVAVTGWIGIWEGELRPITQTYRIGILYFVPILLRASAIAGHKASDGHFPPSPKYPDAAALTEKRPRTLGGGQNGASTKLEISSSAIRRHRAYQFRRGISRIVTGK